MRIYVTKEGERLDEICVKAYGRLWDGLVEAVLDANPGLAALGEVYPAGVKIVLPDISPPETKEEVRLWNYASKFQN